MLCLGADRLEQWCLNWRFWYRRVAQIANLQAEKLVLHIIEFRQEYVVAMLYCANGDSALSISCMQLLRHTSHPMEDYYAISQSCFFSEIH